MIDSSNSSNPSGTPHGLFRVVIFSSRSPKSTWNIARRIARQVPNATVCGIIVKRASANTSWPRNFLQWLTDSVITIIHAFPGKPSSHLELDDFIRDCDRRGWFPLVTDNFDDQTVATFVRSRDADLGIVIGTEGINSQTLALPRQGSLVAYVTLLHDKDPAQLITVRNAHAPSSSSSPVSIRLMGQPYDSRTSNKLKAELLSNDLLVCLVESYADGKVDRAFEAARTWMREMLPERIDECRVSSAETSFTFFTPRTRPFWKMALHTIVLLSPFVVFRNWYRSWRGQFPVIILFHHLVSDRPHPLGIPTQLFLDQVRFLQRYYRIVSLSEALADLRSGSVKAPTAVLTFDDGYEENFMTMRAVTEQTGVPATFFICPNIVSTRRSFAHDDEKNTQSNFRSLAWKQISYWQCSGLEVGSHTRSHFDCGSDDTVVLRDEIVGSREAIEAELGSKVAFFAFPWGKTSNMSSIAIELALATYDCCLSALDSDTFPSNDSRPKIIGRKFLPTGKWELELTMQSVFDFAHRLKLSKRKEGDFSPPF